MQPCQIHLTTPSARADAVTLAQRAPDGWVASFHPADRSNEQNRLQMAWVKELVEQRGDVEFEDQRAEFKLTIGVPILRRDDLKFREEYDKLIRPFDYETKIRLIRFMDWPVSRKMNKAQMSEYLDTIFKTYTEAGFRLTVPEDKT